MALVHEDGSGLANAESYLSVMDADTYWAAHGSPSTWPAVGVSVATKESALRYATRALEARYEWRGALRSTTQALDWPRAGAYDDDGRVFADNAVPVLLKEATAQMSHDHIARAKLDTVTPRLDSVTVGPISVDFASAFSVSMWNYVDGLLQELISGLKSGGYAQPLMLRAG